MTCSSFNERVLRLAAERAARQGPIHAEIVSGEAPRWHILQTKPQQEESTAEHLEDRAFGVYLPRFRTSWTDRFGKKRWRFNNFFPGYLFVFVWDVMRHQHRILAVPGVSSIVYFAGQAATVPDELIDRIQIQEFIAERATAPRPRRRRKNRDRDYLDDDQPGMITIHTRDVWHGMEHLDADTRNLVLRKALGLTL